MTMDKAAAKKTKAETPITDRMRRVCELVVAGMPAGRAYERAGYSARGDVADQAASRLLGTVKVARYLEQLRKEAMERDDLVQYLVDVLKTPVGKIDANHVLAQEWSMDEAGGIKVKMPAKLAAAAQLAAIMGWNKPQEVKVDASDKLADIIRRIRAR
jgi:phage terminase small subunit